MNKSITKLIQSTKFHDIILIYIIVPILTEFTIWNIQVILTTTYSRTGSFIV